MCRPQQPAISHVPPPIQCPMGPCSQHSTGPWSQHPAGLQSQCPGHHPRWHPMNPCRWCPSCPHIWHEHEPADSMRISAAPQPCRIGRRHTALRLLLQEGSRVMEFVLSVLASQCTALEKGAGNCQNSAWLCRAVRRCTILKHLLQEGEREVHVAPNTLESQGTPLGKNTGWLSALGTVLWD